MKRYCELSEFVGKTIVELYQTGFKTDENKIFYFHHDRDCCETIKFVRWRGNKKSILNIPLTSCTLSHDEPPEDCDRLYSDSHTWTVFRFEAGENWCETCFLGESNGYYGEDVVIISYDKL